MTDDERERAHHVNNFGGKTTVKLEVPDGYELHSGDPKSERDLSVSALKGLGFVGVYLVPHAAEPPVEEE